MNEESARAEGHLNQRVGVKLRKLRSLQVGRHEERAIWDILGGVDDLLHVEAATIFLEDILEDDIISFLIIFTLNLAVLNFFP